MKKFTAILLALTLVLGLAACGSSPGETTSTDNSKSEAAGNSTSETADSSQSQSADTTVTAAESEGKTEIGAALNLANIKPEWTYSENADAWTMSIVTAVTNAEPRSSAIPSPFTWTPCMVSMWMAQ